MIFNKQIQNALLFAIYLCASGRTTIDNVSENLNIPKAFLQQTAIRLKKAGIVKSYKGPGGGYELIGNPTILSIFKVFKKSLCINKKEQDNLISGSSEKRILGYFIDAVSINLNKYLQVKVRDLHKASVKEELAVLDNMSLKLEN